MKSETSKPVRDQSNKMDRFISTLRTKIRESGFEQYDSRFDRLTKALPGHFLVIKEEPVLQWLKDQQPLDKFKADYERMKASFLKLIEYAKEDVNNRRLCTINTDNYDEVFPCFLSLQFVWTGREEFDAYVYMRSSDVAKLKDDCVYFANLMSKFEKKTKHKVTKLIVVFANVHYEIDK